MDLEKYHVEPGHIAPRSDISGLISEVSNLFARPNEDLEQSSELVASWLENKFGGFAALWLFEAGLSRGRFVASRSLPASLRNEIAGALSSRCVPEAAWPAKTQSFDFSEVAGVGCLSGIPLMSRGRCFGVAFVAGGAGGKDFTIEKQRELEAAALVLGPGMDALLQSDQRESLNHRYTKKDLEVAEELGRRAGIAMDNARLLEDSQNAIRVRDEFLSIASHELRTPLTSLSLNLQMLGRALSREVTSHSILQAYLDRVLSAGKQAKRLGGLVDMLFDVSRLVHGKLSIRPKPMDLGALCQELALRFADEAKAVGSSIGLSLVGDGQGNWDELRMEQALSNLLSNAIKYAPGKPIWLGVSGNETSVTLVVSDTGKGISESDQKRIFDRFERGSSRGKPSGMGLGLYIVRQVAEAHHGSVTLVSRPDEGSTFTLTLPRGAA